MERLRKYVIIPIALMICVVAAAWYNLFPRKDENEELAK